MSTAIRIALDQLRPAPFNKRDAASYGKTPLADLAASIKARDVLSPIMVRLTDGHYQIIAGHRRAAAAKLAGLTDVPCTVMNISEEEAQEVCAIENLQREDLSLMDEAAQILVMHANGNRTVADIAARIGKPAHFVATRLKLATNLDPKVMKYMEKNGWPVTWWESVARLNKEDQADLIANQHVHHREQLDRAIDGYLKVISKAGFDTSDITLLPAAGACSTCPKRTSQDGDLFPDMTAKKGDRCLDGKCWDQKQKNHNQALLEAARAKHGPDVIPIHTSYASQNELKKFTFADGTKVQSTYYSDDISVTAKTTKGAKPALDVESGKIVWVASPKAASAAGKKKTVANKKVSSLKEKYAFLTQRRYFAICKEIRAKGLNTYSKTPDTKSPFCPTWPKDYGMRELCEILNATTPSMRSGDGSHASKMGIVTVKGDRATCEHLFENARTDIVDGCFQVRTAAEVKVEIIQANMDWFKMDAAAIYKWAVTEVPTPKSLKEYEAQLSK
jgi:ParB/RepB/Spo0J family partition protein